MLRLFAIVFVAFFFLRLPFNSSNHFKAAAQEEENQEEENQEETTEPVDEDTPFEKALKVYLEEYEQYQSAYSLYVTKRSNYLRFKTLQSQQEAQEATVKMLTERDDVVISYLTMLRERLDEAVGIDEGRKSSLHVRIASDLAWFSDHKNKIPSAGSLKDLEEDNKKASQRFTFVEPLFYEILATVSDGRITDFEERLNDTFTEVKTKLDEIKAETREEYQLSDRQLTQLDRWILEAENRVLRAEEKQIAAGTVIDSFTSAAQRKQLPLSIYNTALLRLNEAKQFLKEGGTFVVEILRLIKTKDD